MALRITKVRDIIEMELVLRGGILGGVDITRGVEGLVGKTLTFTAPVGSVVFATASRENDKLLLPDIKSQVETALGAGNIKVMAVDGRIAFVHPSGTTAIALAATNLEAKALLGFDRTSATSGTVYGGSVASPPALHSAYTTEDNAHVLILVES